jgi:hypothetical protein
MEHLTVFVATDDVVIQAILALRTRSVQAAKYVIDVRERSRTM